MGVPARAVTSTLLAAIPALRRPSELPDWPDTSFHLNRIQLFHETGNASLTNPSFYPSAFHTVADSVLSIIPSTPIVAANVTSLVVAAVVWPLGMIALARETIGKQSQRPTRPTASRSRSSSSSGASRFCSRCTPTRSLGSA